MSGAEFHEEDVLGKAYDGRLMRRLLVYLRPYRRLLVGAIAVLLANALLALAGPLFTRQLIDVALPARDAGLAMRLALVLAAVLVVQFALEYAGTMLTSLLGQRVMRDLRMQIFAHLQRLSIAFFDRTPVGRLITRVTSDVEALNELFTAGVVAGVGDLFTLAVIGVVMLIIDWQLALAAFAVIPFVLVTSYLFRKHVRQTYRDIRTRLARINAFLQERLTGMRVVQLFGREAHEAQRFDALNRLHLDAHLRSIRIYALYFPAIELLTSVALASLIVAGADRVAENTLTVGTVAAFLQFVRRFFQPLQDLSEKYNILQAAMASSERIFQLLDTEPTVRDAEALMLKALEALEALEALKTQGFSASSASSAFSACRHRRVRERLVRILGARVGPQGRHVPRSAGRDGGTRRPHGGGEDDDHLAAAALLRPAARPDHDCDR